MGEPSVESSQKLRDRAQPPAGASEPPSPPLLVDPPSLPPLLDELPPSPLGALQTMIGSCGSAASLPHVAPAVTHSADVEQSWIMPSAVIGQPADLSAQTVIINPAPQQIWPLIGHPAASVQATMLASPPPLLVDAPLPLPLAPEDELVLPSSPPSAVVVDEELHAAAATTMLTDVTKRILVLCMGQFPPPMGTSRRTLACEGLTRPSHNSHNSACPLLF
jgi:hypothetical protein